MKAVTYQGMKNVVVKDVADPKIVKRDDMIVRLTTTAICGSDLHLLHGMIPNLQEDYVIGHEPMGIVEEVGPDVTRLKKGDRVIIPFTIACGECYYCINHLESQCDNSNDNGEMGGYFGYSGTTGGHPGGQAEYLRVPFANFTHFKIPESCEHPDETLVLIADAMTTAWARSNRSRRDLSCRGARWEVSCSQPRRCARAARSKLSAYTVGGTTRFRSAIFFSVT